MANPGELGGSRVLSKRLVLPNAPRSERGPVKAWLEEVNIFTYFPERADPNPMFFEKRVYQGSSGKVYPIPFVDRIATEGKDHAWQAIHIENEYLRIMVLPEIGGRIHVGLDKTNDYNFFYRQNVIKPALVGLAGPWMSGGVEFNWPQHHRPATFMPMQFDIERGTDGSVTIWCSDHDPMNRMKGMHGICLNPHKAYLELKVRLYNRTPYVQTFLWWANVATRVHEHYQSFFPPDCSFVADHAKRAISRFPECDRKYYGIDYPERARIGVPNEQLPSHFVPDGSYPANDLRWYANIPVPTSYMIVGSESDFFGGYDHNAQAGVVHVANHHISAGKKQWTWGNHDFGYAWDRRLTDSDGPYIELMAGVYTDNQPDFSFLAPGETKEFSQFWYPIRKIGVPVTANRNAALSLRVQGDKAEVGVCVSENLADANVSLQLKGKTLFEWRNAIRVEQPFLASHSIPHGTELADLSVLVRADGREIISYVPCIADSRPPSASHEPPLPEAISSADELYLTGLHLEQYRHATRYPEAYWRQALLRDPGDCRAGDALGMWHFKRGEFAAAESCFRRAIERLTCLNPNPYDGEPFYSLGLTLRFLHRDIEAYAAFYKAAWDAKWKSAAYYALAELDCKQGDFETAINHLRLNLRVNMDHLNARNLTVAALRKVSRCDEADAILRETCRLDRLDIWSRYLDSGEQPADNQLRIDLALDFARSGLYEDAIRLMSGADMEQLDGSVPIVLYTLAWCQESQGDHQAASENRRRAQNASPLYCFPSRLEEIEILESAIAADSADARAPYYLGNLLYDRRRYDSAIEHWERSSTLESQFATVWRNLAFAYFNVRGDRSRARDAFDRAFAANPADGRVLYERDQLWKRIGVSPEERLNEISRHRAILPTRDDLVVELATLYNLVGRPHLALETLKGRRFQPWEGGEGLVLRQWTRANLKMGRSSLADGDPRSALEYFQAALTPPEQLGEARHLLANQSEILYWAGVAASELGETAEAQIWWQRAAAHREDTHGSNAQPVSELTYWTALALRSLGNQEEAQNLLLEIEAYSHKLEKETTQIDYFATSLPNMLLFNEDVARNNLVESRFLRAQALLGLNRTSESVALLNSIMEIETNQIRVVELLHDATHKKAI
jgi:tetratricopeptide (TPR) repeat protein